MSEGIKFGAHVCDFTEMLRRQSLHQMTRLLICHLLYKNVPKRPLISACNGISTSSRTSRSRSCAGHDVTDSTRTSPIDSSWVAPIRDSNSLRAAKCSSNAFWNFNRSVTKFNRRKGVLYLIKRNFHYFKLTPKKENVSSVCNNIVYLRHHHPLFILQTERLDKKHKLV